MERAISRDGSDCAPAKKKRKPSRRLLSFPPSDFESRIGGYENLVEYMSCYRGDEDYTYPGPSCEETFSIDQDDYHVLVTIMLSFGIRGFDAIDFHSRGVIKGLEGGRVVALDLGEHYTKFLPSSIGRLDGLKNLYLHCMDFLEKLPEEIRHLTNLEYLALSHPSEKFVSLPEGLGCLTNLKQLYLQDIHNLMSLPKSVGCLTNLVELNVSFAPSLKSLPEEIGNLANLETLEVSDSGLETLPDSIGQLKKLRKLKLFCHSHVMGYSELLTLPETIGGLTNLEYLYLKNSAVQEIPETVGDLTNLKSIELCGSSISSLPCSIGRLTNLEDLSLAYTENLHELPKTIGGLIRLEEIHLDDSKISALPASFWQLKNLRSISLCDNNIAEFQATDPATMRLGLLKRFPLLDTIGPLIEASRSLTKEIRFFQFLNKSMRRSSFIGRGKTSTGINPKLWPLFLVNALPADQIRVNDTVAYFDFYDDDYYFATQADCVHQLLVDGRESFVDVLQNRKCA